MPWLWREWRTFQTALMFFTRFPVSRQLPYSEELLNRSSRYFPLVGYLVGLWGALWFWLASLLLPLPVAVLFSMVATIYGTGAFHEDGLADACDGFGGGWSTSEVLMIMKDSRLGTFGTLGLVLVLGAKYQSLCALAPSQIPLALVGGHLLSRLAGLTPIYFLPYVREAPSARARPLAQRTSGHSCSVALLTALPLLCYIPHFTLALLPLALLCWLAVRFYQRRLGGFTGDCLGALQQLSEVMFYLMLLIWPAP